MAARLDTGGEGLGVDYGTPQKENGYVPVANELVEAFGSLNLSGQCWQVMWVVLRYTYGFNRKNAPLSLNFIAKSCNITNRQACRALRTLLDRGVLSKKTVPTGKNDSTTVEKDSIPSVNHYQLNKLYKTWRKTTPARLGTVENDSTVLSKKTPNKDKKRKTEEIKINSSYSSSVLDSSSSLSSNQCSCSDTPKIKKSPKSGPVNTRPYSDVFYDEFSLRFGQKPCDFGHRDRNACLKAMKAGLTLDEWRQVCQLYLSDTDPFYHKNGYRLSILGTNLQKFILVVTGQLEVAPPDPKRADFFSGFRQFIAQTPIEAEDTHDQ